MDLKQSLSAALPYELDYLQTQMKNVYATQAELADRLARLEQRHDGDGRLRSTWSSQTHLPHLLHEPIHHVTDRSYNPAAEAFRNFDQDQTTSLVASIHLDADDEPRRGASRANSVRFDESAINGQMTNNLPARSIADNPPFSRSGSAFGHHPLTERSPSHKSDGRQSSAGHSAHSLHSARNSNSGVGGTAGFECRSPLARASSFGTSSQISGPPPGLFLLGPVPSIIRCWLSTDFSHETLIYAAVCTGSFASTISSTMVDSLGRQEDVKVGHSSSTIRLPVFLPEATVQHSSERPLSPTPQLPVLTVDFQVVETETSDIDAISVVLASDVLRFRNADIHFSLDRLTLLDDERNKVSIPLVRPEDANLFQKLQTIHSFPSKRVGSKSLPARQSETDSGEKPSTSTKSSDLSDHGNNHAIVSAQIKPPSSADKPNLSSPKGSTTQIEKGNGTSRLNRPSTMPRLKDGSDQSEAALNNISTGSPQDLQSNTVSRTSWRRNDTPVLAPSQNESITTTSANPITTTPSSTTSNYQRAIQGGTRTMKVLKPARLQAARSSSGVPDAARPADASLPQSWSLSKTPAPPQDVTRGMNPSPLPNADKPKPSDTEPLPPPETTLGANAAPNPPAGSSQPVKRLNPVGGASAFGWLTTNGPK